MTGIIDVSTDWLALREAEDARARSRDLALAAADRLGPGPIVVHDLGSGTGSMMRWLAPLLPGPQTWVLHDWNPALIAHAAAGDAPLDRTGRPVEIRLRDGELARLAPEDLDGASLVAASALLDVLTEAEVGAIVEACVAVGRPVLFSLSVTGEVRLEPADPRDEAVRSAFNAHQRRHALHRRLLGPDGVGVAGARLRAAGWEVRSARTDWRLSDREPKLLAEWFDSWLGAAVEQRPELAAALGDYRECRAAQRRDGILTAVVAHIDLLAWPR